MEVGAVGGLSSAQGRADASCGSASESLGIGVGADVPALFRVAAGGLAGGHPGGRADDDSLFLFTDSELGRGCVGKSDEEDGDGDAAGAAEAPMGDSMNPFSCHPGQ